MISKVFINQSQIIKLSNNNNLEQEYEIYKKIKRDKNLNIPQLLHFYSINDINCLVVENVGISLDKLNFNLSMSQILKMYNDIKKTIDYLKNLKIVHRDIKPSNITFKNNNFYLIDYNLAAEYNDVKTYFFGNWEFCSLSILKNKINNKPLNLSVVVNNDFISLVYVSLFLYINKLLWSISNPKDKFNLCQKSFIDVVKRFEEVYDVEAKFILFLFNELKKYNLDYR